MSAPARFRSWLASVEFAVTATSVVAALAAGALVFKAALGEQDAYFAVFLAGIGVPNVYADSWTDALDSRRAGVAWALVACVLAVGCFLLAAAGLRSFLDDTAAAAAAFVAVWLVGLVVSRVAT